MQLSEITIISLPTAAARLMLIPNIKENEVNPTCLQVYKKERVAR
jgi:hypothetical protein